MAQATPATMLLRRDGYRQHMLMSTYGGMAQRWVLISSKRRRPQAQRPVDTQLLQ
jgi:hypothetical protein